MVRQQLSDCLIRQPSALPIMLVSAQIEGQAGVLELQKELAGIAGGEGYASSTTHVLERIANKADEVNESKRF
jgi:ATP-dependent protease HslVU (ClpYQ) peptidase subunit